MKCLGLEMYNLHIQILVEKSSQKLKNSAFHWFQGFMAIIFWFIFQFSIFILKESSKSCLVFSYFSPVFEKSVISLAKSYRSKIHFKRMFEFQRSADNQKRNRHCLVYLSCTAENLKVILYCMWDLELANHTTPQTLEKTRQ